MNATPPKAEDKYAHLMRAAEAKPKYVRSITPRLRIVLYIVFGLFGLLAANGLYLASITFLQWLQGESYENHFYQLMFLAHLALGLVLVAPVVIFGLLHMARARTRKNRRAVRIGYALFTCALAILLTGVLLMRVGGVQIINPDIRAVVYWLHFITPLAAVWLYWLHRLAGPRIKWQVGGKIAGVVVAGIAAMVMLQASDARISVGTGPKQGEQYFRPSLARTATGKFIAAETLMKDDYCLKCHEDVYNSWVHSAHKLSSFNNPAYLASVRETRAVGMERDGSVQSSRWCAGCHDPVPFFSGAFDDPNFDDVNDPTSQAGITCTVCHAIQSVGSTRGNGDYVIDEPEHYPFAYSDNAWLQKLNELMVKAKPAFHKQEMLKPFHKSAEFCSTCHKVSLPGELTKYKEWLRGQNHYDSYLLSGVSGHGARSFYYPPVAKSNCNECHMPNIPSKDFGADYDEQLGTLAVKDHTFLGANTAVAWWTKDERMMQRTRQFLKESMRVDIFGIRREGKISGELVAPLRPEVPALVPGEEYLLETVIRTLKLGHHFTQGTSDSNEVWLEITARSGESLIGASGLQQPDGTVDPWSHFVNTFMLDRHGFRINRRNPQDIFTPLYSHQIPPGAGQTVHYRLEVPEGVTEPIEVTVKLNYRKFDTEYMNYVKASQKPGDRPFRGADDPTNTLPVTVLAEDRVIFPIAGSDVQLAADANPPRDIPQWERWNDYGIGMLLKGTAELKQAAEAFSEVERLGRYDGPLNLARVMVAEGDLNAATEALQRSLHFEPGPPPWTYAWLSGVVDRQQGNLERAAESLRGVLETRVPERKFDFSLDYEVRNQLGLTLLDLAQQLQAFGDDAQYEEYLRQAEAEFQRVLETDTENVTAHANLARIYALQDDEQRAEEHRALHQKYKTDDNAVAVAVPLARARYPAANHAAEQLVIYDLQRNLAETDGDEDDGE